MKLFKRVTSFMLLSLALSSCSTKIDENRKLWSEDNVAIMDKYLGGNVLPFMNFDDLKIEYNSQYKCLIFSSKKASKSAFDDYCVTLKDNDYSFIESKDVSQNGDGSLIVDYYKKEIGKKNRIELEAYYYSGFYINAYYKDVIREWPKDVLNNLLKYWKVNEKVIVPPFRNCDEYNCYTYNLDNTFTISCIGGDAINKESREKYRSQLIKDGYTMIDEDTYDMIIKEELTFEIGLLEKEKSFDIYLLLVATSN